MPLIAILTCLMNAFSCLSFSFTSGSLLCTLLAMFLLTDSVIPYSPDRTSAKFCVSLSRTWLFSLLLLLASLSLACSTSRYSGSCLFSAFASLFFSFSASLEKKDNASIQTRGLGVTVEEVNTFDNVLLRFHSPEIVILPLSSFSRSSSSFGHSGKA